MRSLNPKVKLEQEGLRIAKLLQQSGFKAFWVGGTVRDTLLKRELDNLDIATNAKPEETEKILSRNKYSHKPIGKAYGTILAITPGGPIEITTFRREGRYINRRRPEEVTYIDNYLEDSKRRDFTINSMYYDPVNGELLDPQNGRKDLERKLLRFVGDPRKRIDEDALRMLRAVRFVVQLGFKLEKNSFAAIKTRAKYIQSISGERIKSELDKIMLSPHKEQGIEILDGLGLLRFILPEISNLKQVTHKSKFYHLEGSVFEHSLLALKNVPAGDLILAYAALFHDTGKISTGIPKQKPEGLVNSFPAHENVSAKLFKNFAKRLKFSRKETDAILWITQMHMKHYAFIRDMSESKKITLAQHKLFPQLLEIWRADAMSNARIENEKTVFGNDNAYQEGLNYLNKIHSKKNLIHKLTDGKIIMKYSLVPPGPKVGALKSSLTKLIVDGKISTLRDAENFLKRYAKNT